MFAVNGINIFASVTGSDNLKIRLMIFMLGITGALNREDVTQSDRLWVEDDGFRCEVVTDKRVGIGYAGEEDRNRLWRFIGKEKGAGL